MYEFAVMVSIALLGFCGVPWWTVLPAAAFLSLQSLVRLVMPGGRLHDGGVPGPVVVSGIYSLFAIVCFAGGRSIAWLMPAG
jgi:hypothetical protein